MSLPDRLIVDTSVLIDYLRGRPQRPALESVSEIYLPAMVLAELQIGWLRALGRHTDRSSDSKTSFQSCSSFQSCDRLYLSTSKFAAGWKR